MAHYIHDEKNNRIEGLSKEEIYALIDEVIESGELPTDLQAAFVTAFKSIVDGNAYKMGFCTQAQYNELVANDELETNALYIITDDSSYDDLMQYLDSAIASMQAVLAAKPYTSELMQAEASEGNTTTPLEILLNDMTNNDNFIEVTGFVSLDATTPRYIQWFNHKTKANNVYQSGVYGVSRGQSLILVDDNNIKVTTNVTYGSSAGFKINASVTNEKPDGTANTHEIYFKITSVKELINY